LPVTVRGGGGEAAARADCNICGGAATIELLPGPAGESLPAELREGLVCEGCGSISRDRALILALAGLLGERGPLSGWVSRPQERLFETSGYRGHPGFLAARFDYFNTIYAASPDDAAAGGGPIDGRTTADVQDMPYPDDFFGVILSSEVLEHVADERRAIAEMARTLAPGGHLVLQVPYGHTLERNLRKVHRWHGRDVYLYPPEYHAEDTLVYRIYGRELLDQLGAAGFSVAYVELDLPALGIVPQGLILGRLGGYVDLAGFAVGPR
jgi:SAM-dependent methyltransferase